VFDLATATAIAYSEALEVRGGRGPGLSLRARRALFDRLVYGKIRAAFGGRTRWAISGGAALGPRLGHFFRGVGVTVLEGYGLTETTAAATVNTRTATRIGWQANRLALRQAEAAGAFEALLLNERGLLAEGARSNVVLALPEGLFTPPVADGCLPGTVRRRLLEAGTIVERSLTQDDLRRAREVFLLNSLIGVLPVGRLEDKSPGHL